MKSTLESYYFSNTVKGIVAVVSVIGIYFLTTKTAYAWVSIFLIVISLLIFSAKYVLVIDGDKKTITDSFYLLWMRNKAESFNYNKLLCLRMDKQRHTYTANSRARTAQTDFSEYIAVLEFDSKSLEMERSTDYSSFIEEVNRIAAELAIPIKRTF